MLEKIAHRSTLRRISSLTIKGILSSSICRPLGVPEESDRTISLVASLMSLKKGWLSASSTVTRFFGLNCSIPSSKLMASAEAPLYLCRKLYQFQKKNYIWYLRYITLDILKTWGGRTAKPFKKSTVSWSLTALMSSSEGVPITSRIVLSWSYLSTGLSLLDPSRDEDVVLSGPTLREGQEDPGNKGWRSW